jgi:hypothetical protein
MATPAVCYGGDSGGNNSVVECDLAKVEVAGSNPVSRSIRLRALDRLARYGVMPRRRADGARAGIPSLARS